MKACQSALGRSIREVIREIMEDGFAAWLAELEKRLNLCNPNKYHIYSLVPFGI